MPSSPIFQMSSCLTGGGGVRSYRLDLDIVAKSSSSPSPCSSTSSPSSTLSESSNSTPLFISTNRARAPRKRPNQCSAEAAALLSSIYPKLFSSTNLHRQTLRHQQPITDHFPVLLPSFPIPGDDSLLLHNPSSPLNPPFELKPPKVFPTSICSPPNSHIECPQSPNFDAESILDEEVEEGIDSILGNLSMSKESSNKDYVINPYLAGVMRFKPHFGFGFGISSNTRCALRHSNDGEWWRSPTVAVTDIAPKLDALSKKLAISDKKKKKKKKKIEKDDGIERKANASSSSPKDGVLKDGISKDGILKDEILKDGILKPQLGLKLNYDGILNAWSGPPPFSGDTGSPETAADVIARITEIDLFPDAGGGLMREASVQRYKEKRRNRLYSKKIRYEVRKANADQRPRMKASGRFVRTASLFKISMGEGSQ